MSFVQRIVLFFMPKSRAEKTEQESREWMIRCSCGHEISVWEAGGIRAGARGKKRIYGKCRGCGKNSWMTIERRQANVT